MLDAANTYTGATIAAGGTIFLGAAENVGVSGPLGASPANNPGSIILGGGYLEYSSVNQNDYSGRFSTAANQCYNANTNSQNVIWATPLVSSGGSLGKSGAGTLVLLGSNTYGGPTAITGGAVLIFGSGVLGGGSYGNAIGMSNDSTLAFQTSSNQTLGGVISGNGALYQLGSGVTTLAAGVNLNAGSTLTVSTTYAYQIGNSYTSYSGNSIAAIGCLVNGGTLVQTAAATTFAAGSEYVGETGSGAFVQAGGANSLPGFPGGVLCLGYTSGGSGTYSLVAGNLSAPFETVGQSGNGTFTQTGGVNSLPFPGGVLYVAAGSGGLGTYNLNGGLLSAAVYEYVGVSGTGSLAQSAGTNTVGDQLCLGYFAGSSGSYSLSGTGVLSALCQYTSISGNGYPLAFTQPGGECLGVYGSGTFAQSGGTNTASSIYLGYFPGASGSYVQSGGVNSVSSTGVLCLGYSAGATGSYNLGGSGMLTVSGTEIVGCSGAGTFNQSGGTNLVSGVFSLGAGGTYNLSGGALVLPGIQGAGGTFNLGGGTLVANAGFSTSQPMTLTGSGGNGNLNTGGYPITLSGALSGPGGLNEWGGGTLLLTAVNTYSGGTTISTATLKLDFSQAGAPTANIINNTANSSSLTLGGGMLIIQGNANATNSQRFNGLAVNPGSSAIVLTAGASNPLLLSLGGISRSAGGTLDFTLPGGTPSANNGITTSTPNTCGILGGYATVGGTDWAAWNGTDIVAYSAYTGGDLGALSSSSTQNVEPTGSQSAVTSARSFNTLNLTGALSVAMSGAGALTLVGGGLIGNTSGTISGGALAGSAGGDLIVITPANFTIGSVIANNGGGTGLTKAGPATLILTGVNTYSGATVVGAGVLQIGNGGSGASIGGTSSVLDNGSLVFNHSDSVTFSSPSMAAAT